MSIIINNYRKEKCTLSRGPKQGIDNQRERELNVGMDEKNIKEPLSSRLEVGGQETNEAMELPNNGLLEKWEQAQEALVAVQEKIGKKWSGINRDRCEAIKRLKILLPSVSERVEEDNRSGVLIGRDGREIAVSVEGWSSEITVDDLADPERRSVVIGFDELSLVSREDICIDQITGFLTGSVRRTDLAKKARRHIRGDEQYAHLRGDLKRDVLDVAVNGLRFILDPETTLKG